MRGSQKFFSANLSEKLNALCSKTTDSAAEKRRKKRNYRNKNSADISEKLKHPSAVKCKKNELLRSFQIH